MIPIDEQIAYAQQLVNDGKYPEYARGIFASLERLKRIDSVQVPDEPDAVKYLREKFGDGSKGFVRLWDGRAIAIVNLIDTLRVLLKKVTAERDACAQMNDDQARRVYAAESKLAAIERTRKPNYDQCLCLICGDDHGGLACPQFTVT
jgi:hypothetical protein